MSDSAGLSALIQACGGACGAVVATLVLQPLEVIKTKVQVERHRKLSANSATIEIIKSDGFSAFFRGLGTKGVDAGSRYFLFFLAYDAIGGLTKRFLQITPAVNIVVSYLAGVVAVTGTQPFDTAGTKLSAGVMKGSLFSVLLHTLRKEGFRGLYVGYGFNLILCTNPAISNTLFDRMKSAILLQQPSNGLRQTAVLSPFQGFALGAVTKAIAVFLTYPLTRLKVILQVAEKNDDTSAQLHMSSREFSLKESITEAYRGLFPQLLKAMLQASFLYMTKEQVEGVVRKMFHLIFRSRLRRLHNHSGNVA